MTLAQNRYGDPLAILLREEEKSCKTCEHYSKITMFGSVHAICDLRQPVGKQCKSFKKVTEK